MQAAAFAGGDEFDIDTLSTSNPFGRNALYLAALGGHEATVRWYLLGAEGGVVCLRAIYSRSTPQHGLNCLEGRRYFSQASYFIILLSTMAQ